MNRILGLKSPRFQSTVKVRDSELKKSKSEKKEEKGEKRKTLTYREDRMKRDQEKIWNEA